MSLIGEVFHVDKRMLDPNQMPEIVRHPHRTCTIPSYGYSGRIDANLVSDRRDLSDSERHGRVSVSLDRRREYFVRAGHQVLVLHASVVYCMLVNMSVNCHRQVLTIYLLSSLMFSGGS